MFDVTLCLVVVVHMLTNHRHRPQRPRPVLPSLSEQTDMTHAVSSIAKQMVKRRMEVRALL